MNDVLSEGRMQQLPGIFIAADTPDMEMQTSPPNSLPANAQVAFFAAIPEASTPSRKSKRRAASADEHSLERAEKIKAAKNLDAPLKQGNQTAEITFLNLSTEYVSHNLANLGMCLGNDTAAVHSTMTSLRIWS
jgi:hypothetical protein